MRVPALIALLAALAASQAVAAPHNGFGLQAGLSAHSIGVPQQYATAGAGLLGEAQFVVNSGWSLAPFLELSVERDPQDALSTYYKGAAGLEVRRWFGGLFLGAHVAYYTSVQQGARATSNAYGPGQGAAIGGERDSGLLWSLQLDTQPSLFARTPDQVALMALVGWRWQGGAP